MAGPVCQLPPATTDKVYMVDCPQKSSECHSEPGKNVPSFTLLTFHCKDGYRHNGGNVFVSSCLNGTWFPTIAKCFKTCPPLKASNVDLTCFRRRNGAAIPCNESLPEGALVYPKCKLQYHKETEVDYQYIQCQRNGHWDRDIFKCIPDCGKVSGNLTALIYEGKPERHGDSPWHVAVYDVAHNKEPELICGGTIISPQIIVSAAHCFFDTSRGKLFEPSIFEIAVSKVTRRYDIKDNSETKIYKIRKIFPPSELVDFTGDSTRYAGDIVILWTTAKITFTRVVLPACVDWTETTRFMPNENTPGKLVGWGETEEKKPSDVLLATLLPYISYTNCRKIVSAEFADSIALDKFCGGKAKGGFLSYFKGILGKRELRILILGLDGAGKTTILYRLQVGEVVTTIPTIGFNVELQVIYKNLKFQVWDLGGQTSIRLYWRCYYSNTDAIIYVVDSADKDRIGISKEEFFHMLRVRFPHFTCIRVLSNGEFRNTGKFLMYLISKM